jgi:5-methylthioadenosine/S-adenosylhomocysteine deaminase
VVHCPSSNLKLGSGIAPIPTYIEKGINVALGTDGCASNNNLDMVEEMRLAALLHKGVNHNPTLIPAREALKMATLNGAKALGLDDKIGSIEVGKLADLLLININNTFMQPIYDYYSAIVYSMNSSCIDTVLANGKPLMINNKIITIK